MGVKGLRRILKNRVFGSGKGSTETAKQGYRGGIVENLEEGTNVSTLDIDANFLFYVAARYAYGMGEFGKDPLYMKKLRAMSSEDRDTRCFEIIEQLLMFVIRKFKPRHAVTVNVDGAVPMTKISQQRPRRYVAALDVKKDDLFNTSYITPGTLWMISLDKFLLKAMTRIYNSMLQEGLGVSLVYSSHLVPGEGEHKLFQRMKSTKDRYSDIQGIRVVFGGDTDLILLAMISRIDRIFVATDLYFEFSDKKFDDKIIKVKANDFDDPIIINIDIMRKGIKTELNLRETAVDDFVFIISLVGNDFIPRLPSMMALSEAVDSTINAMRLSSISIIAPGTRVVNWYNVLKLLEILVEGDDRKKIYSDIDRITIYNKSLGKNKAQWRPFEKAQARITPDANFSELFREEWYANALGPRNAQMLDIDEFEIESGEIVDMCLSYLFGISWTSKYYNYGSDAVTWSWYYKFYYAPMLTDIVKVLRLILQIDNGLSLLDCSPKDGEIRINPLHQMVAVIPPVATNKVPPQIKSLWNDKSLVADSFVIGMIIDQDGYTPHPDNPYYKGKFVPDSRKDPSWEGTVILPGVEYENLIQAVAELDISGALLEAFSFKQDIHLGNFLAEPSRNTTSPKAYNNLNIPSRGKKPFIKEPRQTDDRKRKVYKNTRQNKPIDTDKARQRDFTKHTVL